jgi:hypothetical protein
MLWTNTTMTRPAHVVTGLHQDGLQRNTPQHDGALRGAKVPLASDARPHIG